MIVEDLDKAIAAAETELGDLEAQRAATVERLSALKKQRRDTPPAVRDTGGSSAEWSSTRKVELFRSLFRGREDVFAVRWENSAKRRSGYAPRCANEWKPGICGKPRVRCGACPNQAFLAASAAEVLAHLRGRQVVGIYPLLADDTCWLLAIDLDGDRWRDDAAALRQACLELGLTPAVERSRSGAGAHLWLFFESPIPATQARALGELLLTRAMARCPSLKMDSYDRLFPSQDTLPDGGFGNLIALPLQRAARDEQNTLFLDERLEPFADQWGFLASLSRVSLERLDEILADVRSTESRLRVRDDSDGDRTPWRPAKPLRARLIDADLPATVPATLAPRLYVERDGLPACGVGRASAPSHVRQPRVPEASGDAVVHCVDPAGHCLLRGSRSASCIAAWLLARCTVALGGPRR